MQHLRWASTMNSSVIGGMETDLIPGILDVLLADCLETLQITPVHQPLDLFWLLHWVLCLGIVSLLGWAVAIPADVPHISSPNSELPTQQITFLHVTVNVDHKGGEFNLLVDLLVHHQVPNEATLLQIHKRKHNAPDINPHVLNFLFCVKIITL